DACDKDCENYPSRKTCSDTGIRVTLPSRRPGREAERRTDGGGGSADAPCRMANAARAELPCRTHGVPREPGAGRRPSNRSSRVTSEEPPRILQGPLRQLPVFSRRQLAWSSRGARLYGLRPLRAAVRDPEVS